MKNQRYRNINATPRDRISDKMFFSEFGVSMPDGSDGDDIDEEISDIFPSGVPLAMAYVPWQRWGDLYSEEDGYKKGTLFRDLDFPFMGDRMGGASK